MVNADCKHCSCHPSGMQYCDVSGENITYTGCPKNCKDFIKLALSLKALKDLERGI